MKEYEKDHRKIQNVLTYIALGLFSIVIICLYYYSDLADSLFPNAYNGTVSFIYFLFIIPITAIIYGIVSYVRIRKIIVPHIVLLICTVISVIVFGIGKNDVNIIEEVVSLPVIMVVISLLFSLATMLVIKTYDRFK